MIGKLATNKFLKNLEHLESGTLSVTTPDGKTREFEGKKPGLAANLNLKQWNVPANVARKGDVGLAEDYRDGAWDTDNLENLIALGLNNKQALDQYIFGTNLSRIREMLAYFFRKNSVRGSRKNIHAHYDLGNEFYKLWLDPTMTYSSAIYNIGDEDLVAAQHNKYDRIIDRLDANSGSVLEIGCGWGGFAERAVERGDFGVKGITLSQEQHDFAKTRVDGKAEIVLEDYRHQTGKFDHIVSIEMFEAVGEKYWGTYFDKVSELLSKKGKAVIQTITMNEDDFDNYRKGSDFIRSFIFPGGMLPSMSKFKEKAAASGLVVTNTYAFGQDYARTLRQWLNQFDAKIDAVKNMGFDDEFIRLWRFYLAACAAGFHTGRTDVMQVELVHA
jgi:cyclopropane-fatty-acyl-phospholipid synthase